MSYLARVLAFAENGTYFKLLNWMSMSLLCISTSECLWNGHNKAGMVCVIPHSYTPAWYLLTMHINITYHCYLCNKVNDNKLEENATHEALTSWYSVGLQVIFLEKKYFGVSFLVQKIWREGVSWSKQIFGSGFMEYADIIKWIISLSFFGGGG